MRVEGRDVGDKVQANAGVMFFKRRLALLFPPTCIAAPDMEVGLQRTDLLPLIPTYFQPLNIQFYARHKIEIFFVIGI